jgi:hypothetical protein
MSMFAMVFVVINMPANMAAPATVADISAETANESAAQHDPFTLQLNFTSHPNAGPLLSIKSDEPEIADPDDLLADPFAKGSRYWTLTAGISRDAHIGRIYLAQLSLDDYISDDLAIRWGLTFGYANPDDVEGGVQGGPELGIRWHFFTRERFSIYIDSSVGLIFHENPLTEDSLRFNFDVQAGLGATLQLSDQMHLQSGVRWHHLSNARIRGKEENLGYDGPMLYFGVMKAF